MSDLDTETDPSHFRDLEGIIHAAHQTRPSHWAACEIAGGAYTRRYDHHDLTAVPAQLVTCLRCAAKVS